VRPSCRLGVRLSSSLVACALSPVVVSACGAWGGGSTWIQQPLVPEEERSTMQSMPTAPGARLGARTLGARPAASESPDPTGGGGKVLGLFRNTYYDFPNESDHTGARIALMNGSCEPIAKVPRGFYDAVCVQGSGSLARGGTVSFAKRDCACAEVCPRTGQRICFDALDKAAYPWGRGAGGTPIKPLRSVAADTSVLPMGTVLYIPELDGVARENEGGVIDGCFVVEDRGLRVQGEHIDIFTGQPSQTAALNAQVPSNRGVTVVVDAPRCAHLAKH
jgi:3D (Asp-Asp-Asp) domain-containing protein